MTANERISHILVALPIAHILGSSLFLWSYCVGFGYNIISHITASDLLSVSIRDMVLSYILSLFMPAAMSLSRLSSPQPYAMDRAVSIVDDNARESAIKHVRSVRKFITYASILLFIICISITIWDIYHGNKVPYIQLQMGFTFIIALSIMSYCEHRNVSPYVFETSTIITVFVLSILFQGLSKGQDDRLEKYNYAKESNTLCKSAAILRPLSGNFIAVLPNDRKVIISPECAIRFQIGMENKSDIISPSPESKDKKLNKNSKGILIKPQPQKIQPSPSSQIFSKHDNQSSNQKN